MILSEIGYEAAPHDEAVDWVIHCCFQRKLEVSERITFAIEQLVEMYEKLYNVSASEINEGLCEDFAQDLIKIMNRVWGYDLESFWGEDLIMNETGKSWEEIDPIDSHCFVEFDGTYYDSEAPEGVQNWKDLPLFGKSKC